MFSHEITEREVAWSAVFGRIELAAIEARMEIHEMAEAARDAIDRRLGYSEQFINRARAQRRRHRLERLKGEML